MKCLALVFALGLLVAPGMALTQDAAARAPSNAESAFWAWAKNSPNAGDVSAYLETYPNGAFAPQAKARLAQLSGASPAAADQPSAIGPAPPVVISSQEAGSTGLGAPSLRGSFVYVYSFLDVREEQLGPAMLDQIDAQLTSDLAVYGVRSKILRFRDSQVGENFSTSSLDTRLPRYPGVRRSDPVPVGSTILANRPDEVAAGARYRLIEFPVSLTNYYPRGLISGGGAAYKIQWTLIDIETNRQVFTIERQFSYSYLFGARISGTGPAGMIGGLMHKLKSAGLL